jgi:hypothetical protein
MYACKLNQIDKSLMYIYDIDYGILIRIGKILQGALKKKKKTSPHKKFTHQWNDTSINHI